MMVYIRSPRGAIISSEGAKTILNQTASRLLSIWSQFQGLDSAIGRIFKCLPVIHNSSDDDRFENLTLEVRCFVLLFQEMVKKKLLTYIAPTFNSIYERIAH